jgi:MFS family permease
MKIIKSSRSILNILGIGTAISLLGESTLYTVLPHPSISAQLGISLSMAGLLLGANRATRLLLNGPVGILYDRLPRRGLLITALFLGAGSSIFYATGYGFWPLLMGRICWGLAWSLLWVGGNSVVLDISTEEDRGHNSGIYQMWFFIGVASASFSGAVFTDMFGFRNSQWISVIIIAAMALVWFFCLPETRINETTTAKDTVKESDNGETVKLPWDVMITTSFAIFISRFMAWGVLAATAVLWLSNLFAEGTQIASVFIPILTLSGIYAVVRSLASIGSARLAGSVSDRLGRRWPVIGLAMILGCVGLWFMSGDVLSLALVGAFLVPIANSSTETLIPAIAGDRVPKRLRGRALGLNNIAGDLGATIGPFAALGILNSGWLSLGDIYKIGVLFFGVVAILALSPLVSKQSKILTNVEKIT